jgi:hypothetical protein
MQDEILVKSLMDYHRANPVIYQQHNICFRSIKSLMAAQLNVKESEMPFTAPQIELRWRVLVSQEGGCGTSDHMDIEPNQTSERHFAWDDKEVCS